MGARRGRFVMKGAGRRRPFLLRGLILYTGQEQLSERDNFRLPDNLN